MDMGKVMSRATKWVRENVTKCAIWARLVGGIVVQIGRCIYETEMD